MGQAQPVAGNQAVGQAQQAESLLGGLPPGDKSKSETELLQKDFSTFLANMVQKANIHKNMAAESIAARKGFGGQALV